MRKNLYQAGRRAQHAYKDAPELSMFLLRSSTSIDIEPGVEKTLLVNPNCPVRVMLEYIRKKCKLGTFTEFDLAEKSGLTKGLFSMPTYVNAADQFEHKQTYYLIVVLKDKERRISILPQLSHENDLYELIKERVKRYLLTGEYSVTVTPVSAPATKKK